MKENIFNDAAVAIPVDMSPTLANIFTSYGGIIEKDENGIETYNVTNLDPYKFALGIIKECTDVATVTEQLGWDNIREKILFNFRLIASSKK